MPNRPFRELRGLVGATRRTVEGLRVEPGKVAEFARAIHDPAAVYRSESAAHAAGHHRIPAPPTFTRTAFFPRYRPDGVGTGYGFDLGFTPEYVLHGEQRYAYERPVYVGDELHAETTLADVSRRDGDAAGEMTFAVLRTDFYDAADSLVVTAWNTRIETPGPVADGADPPTGDIDAADAPRGLDVGDAAPTVDVGPLARRDFVRYAGASGDFNPVHYDEPHATDAGHPSVFAQGMLSAGVLSRLAREWVGLDALAEFRTRFTARAFPGDALTARGRVTDVTETPTGRAVDAALEVVADDGRKVVDGSLRADRERQPPR